MSTKYSSGAFSFAMFVLRVTAGALMMFHGYNKLIKFNAVAAKMPSLFGMSPTITTALVVFAEFFCALFVLIGLFTRYACIPVIICMGYALFVSHKGLVFTEGEQAALFLGAFLTIAIVGPGRASVDGMAGK